MLEAKAFLLSPALLGGGGVIPLKHTIQKSPCMDAVPYRGPLFFEQGRSVPAPRAAAAEAAATAAAEAAATE